MQYLKKLTTLSIGLMMSWTLSAQDLSRFSFEAVYGIEHVEINNNGTNFFVPKNKKQRAENFGFNLNYRLNDRFLFKTGLRYTQLTHAEVSNVFIECGNTTQEEIALMREGLTRPQYEIGLISAARYYFLREKPFLNTYVEGGTGIINSDEGVRPDLSIAFGFELPVFQKTTLFIQPIYRFAWHKKVNSQALDAQIQQHNLGVAVGLKF